MSEENKKAPTLSSYEPVVVHIKRKTATDADVDAYINELLDRHGHWEHVKRAVQPSDYILVDMQTAINGAPSAELSGEHMSIDLSPGKMPSGFIKGVQGMTIGQTQTFSFSAARADGEHAAANDATCADGEHDAANDATHADGEHPAPNETSKTAASTTLEDKFDVTLTLHDICIRVRPELNDRFVCEALTDSGSTVAELRKNTQKIVQEHMDVENAKRQEMAADIELSRRLTTPVPDETIKDTAAELYKTLTSNLQSQNITLKQYMESQNLTERQFQMELLSQARDSLRQGLALDALFAHLQKTQNASIEDEDIQRALGEMAPGRESEAEEYLKENNSWDSALQMAQRLKAHDWLMETATFL